MSYMGEQSKFLPLTPRHLLMIGKLSTIVSANRVQMVLIRHQSLNIVAFVTSLADLESTFFIQKKQLLGSNKVTIAPVPCFPKTVSISQSPKGSRLSTMIALSSLETPFLMASALVLWPWQYLTFGPDYAGDLWYLWTVGLSWAVQWIPSCTALFRCPVRTISYCFGYTVEEVMDVLFRGRQSYSVCYRVCPVGCHFCLVWQYNFSPRHKVSQC